MPESAFYLGRIFDLTTSQLTQQPFFYDPADLTTHAIVTGMTGSGKTGLCIVLLEEAALQGIPALIVDPKGDLTNLLLHFPELSPQDFQPWIDPLLARRSGKTLEEAAAEAASAWQHGLGDWGITSERLRDLANSVEFAIYTPGSKAGQPISIIASLSKPMEGEIDDTLSERISSLVTALLALIGIQADPIRSREHILLSNIFENAWRNGREIDLSELILQTQSPPFEKLGAFPVDTFFPPKERAELAIALNSILASPTFQVWREGQPLDINSLLFTPEGRPRHNIFYLAHLSESERMFFVTLLLNAIESWMRSQSGTASLRAIFYMDEIFGYLPPLANPPAKKPLLRLLKQGRAFGLGMLLATQNPADIDYKGLSNAGTWFIGKLQTEQDKERLLDGLQSINSTLARTELNKLLSSLGKRVFLMQNVHRPAPLAFQTRWTMNFLAGPIAPAQLPALNALASGSLRLSRPHPASQEDLGPTAVPRSFAGPGAFSKAAPTVIESSQSRPSLPTGIGEYFFPILSLPQAFQAAARPVPTSIETEALLLYRPALLAVAQVHFLNHKYGVDSKILRAVLIPSLDRRLTPRWEDFPYQGPALEKLESVPDPSARFALLPAPLSDAKFLAVLRRDFVEWVYRTTSVKAKANKALNVYAGPDVSQAEFMKACAETARQARDAEVSRQVGALERRIKAVQEKLAREERELRRDEAEYQQRRIEELGTHAENILGLFSRRSTRRLSTSLTRRRLTEQAKAEVEESLDAIEQYKEELAALEQERAKLIEEIHTRWAELVNQIEEITLKPRKSDIMISFFGIAWRPFYLVKTPEGQTELAAFEY